MAVTRSKRSVSGAVPRNVLYNARRLGALGLVRLASCILRSAIGLYQRQMISQSGVRVALSMTGRLEKSALVLLLGRKRNQPQSDVAAVPWRGGES
jgi:hypothetical protein